MADYIDPEMAQAYAASAKSSVLNRLYAARLKRDGRMLHSRLLRSISRSDHIQARRMLMYIRGKLGDTFEYLEEMSARKHRNATQHYPQLAERLNKEDKKKAAEAFEQFGEVAGVHEDLLNDVLTARVDDSTNYHVCQICGYIAVNDPPLNCPVCNAVQEKFLKEE
jgi:rubrerythrin